MTIRKIEKCAAIILDNGKILLTRKIGTDIFISPGGKLNSNESHLDCLRREIKEELNTGIYESRFIETFYGVAEFENVEIIMHTYLIKITNTPSASSEIDEIIWLDCNNIDTPKKIGSMLKNHIIPFVLRNNTLIKP